MYILYLVHTIYIYIIIYTSQFFLFIYLFNTIGYNAKNTIKNKKKKNNYSLLLYINNVIYKTIN